MSIEREATVTVRTNVAAVCGDSTRYNLGGVMVSESGVAAATDGRCMSVTEVDVEGEIGQDANDKLELKERRGWQLIPGKLIKRPTANIPTKLILNGRVECVNTSKIGDYDDGRFPRIGDCLPSVSLDWIGVKIDAALLKSLAETVCNPGDSAVVLLMNSKEMDGPICVRPTHADSPGSVNIGVLMPIANTAHNKRSIYDEICDYNNARDRLIADLPVEFKK